MPFEIVRNDIVNMQVDAVVNTANPNPIVGTGVDRAIHTKAGSKLLTERKKIGCIKFGDAAVSPGFDLDAKYVIHAAGPVWQDGNHGEEQILSSCYRKSLELAKENGCESIAFPLISTGNYGFPKNIALQVAIREISAFLLENDMQVYLVVFEKEAFELSEKLFKSVSSFIDENYIAQKTLDEYGRNQISSVTRRNSIQSKSKHEHISEEILVPQDSDGLENIVKNLDKGFSETLLRLIDRTGRKDSEIYKKANVDRKLFSKIRNNPDYKPSKTTALAFALALELDIDETRDFLSRAGYALSKSNKFDVIVEYFLVNKIYDVYELNEVLFYYEQPLIGD